MKLNTPLNSVKLSSNHYVVIKSTDGELKKVTAIEVQVGDNLVDFQGKGIPIISIENSFVPGEELVNIYTPSTGFIGNGFLATTWTKIDHGNAFIPAMTLLSKYVHPKLPQILADFVKMTGLSQAYISLLSIIY